MPAIRPGVVRLTVSMDSKQTATACTNTQFGEKENKPLMYSSDLIYKNNVIKEYPVVILAIFQESDVLDNFG